MVASQERASPVFTENVAQLAATQGLNATGRWGMTNFNQIGLVLNAVAMFANLMFYAWVSQSPINLAVGIFCGFVFLFCTIVERTKP